MALDNSRTQIRALTIIGAGAAILAVIGYLLMKSDSKKPRRKSSKPSQLVSQQQQQQQNDPQAQAYADTFESEETDELEMANLTECLNAAVAAGAAAAAATASLLLNDHEKTDKQAAKRDVSQDTQSVAEQIESTTSSSAPNAEGTGDKPQQKEHDHDDNNNDRTTAACFTISTETPSGSYSCCATGAVISLETGETEEVSAAEENERTTRNEQEVAPETRQASAEWPPTDLTAAKPGEQSALSPQRPQATATTATAESDKLSETSSDSGNGQSIALNTDCGDDEEYDNFKCLETKAAHTIGSGKQAAAANVQHRNITKNTNTNNKTNSIYLIESHKLTTEQLHLDTNSVSEHQVAATAAATTNKPTSVGTKFETRSSKTAKEGGGATATSSKKASAPASGGMSKSMSHASGLSTAAPGATVAAASKAAAGTANKPGGGMKKSTSSLGPLSAKQQRQQKQQEELDGERRHMHDLVVYEFHFPRVYCGKLIGKNGVNVDFIRSKTHTQIAVRDDDQQEELQIVCVSGRLDDVDQALDIIGQRFPAKAYPNISFKPISKPILYRRCRLDGATAAAAADTSGTNGSASAAAAAGAALSASTPTVAKILVAPNMYVDVADVAVVNDPVTTDGQQQQQQQQLFSVHVTAVVSSAQVFIQLPSHPSFENLQKLDKSMLAVYSQSSTAAAAEQDTDDALPPFLVEPIGGGTICAAPTSYGWHRAMVTGYQTSDEARQQLADYSESCGLATVKFLDYGGYLTIPTNQLRQLRSDFMMLPFQAVECYLDGIFPIAGSEEEGKSVLSEILKNSTLKASLNGYAEDGMPIVNLFHSNDLYQNRSVSAELVKYGVVSRIDNATIEYPVLLQNGHQDAALNHPGQQQQQPVASLMH